MPYADPAVWYDIPATNTTTLIAGIKTALTAAGWTNTDTYASATGTFIGIPADGETVAVDGVTMTAKTTPTLPTHFALGSTATEAATNLTACINTNVASVDATSSAGVVTVTASAAGSGGNSIALTEGLTNFTWASATLMGGGFLGKSGVAPDGKRFAILFTTRDDGGVAVQAITRSIDGTLIEADISPGATTSAHVLTSGTGQRRTIFAHPYGIRTCTPGASTDGTVFMAELLWQGSAEIGVLITGATNATPIQITTASAHGMTTGQQVYIDNVGGNTAANGLWTVTAAGGPTSTTLTLNTSVGNGAYTTGGALASVTGGQVSRCWFAVGTTPFRSGPAFRTDLSNASAGHGWVVTNQNSRMNDGNVAGRPRVLLQESSLRNEGGRYVVTEAIIRWHSTDGATVSRWQGGLYNAAYTTAVRAMDEEFDTPDGKHWICYSDNDAEGSLLFRIPATVTTL